MSELEVPDVRTVGDISWDSTPNQNGKGFKVAINVPVVLREWFSSSEAVIGLNLNVMDSGSDMPAEYVVNTSTQIIPAFRNDMYRTRERKCTLLRVAVYALRGTRILPSIDLPGKVTNQSLRPGRYKGGNLTIQVDLYIVQDSSHLPTQGEPLKESHLFPSYDVGLDEEDGMTLTGLQRSMRRFAIRHVPNAVEIKWLYTGQTLKLQLPQPEPEASDTPKPVFYDGDCGFSFSINPDPYLPENSEGDLIYNDLVHIRTFGDVKVTLSDIKNIVGTYSEFKNGGMTYFQPQKFLDPLKWHQRGKPSVYLEGEDTSDFRDLMDARFFRLEKVSHLDDLPAAHAVFRIEDEWEDVAAKEYLSYYHQMDFTNAAHLLIDVGVGFIPIVGDIADFAEFNYMLATGEDKWGKKVTTFDIALQGIAVIPLFGDGVKLLGRLMKRVQN